MSAAPRDLETARRLAVEEALAAEKKQPTRRDLARVGIQVRKSPSPRRVKRLAR